MNAHHKKRSHRPCTPVLHSFLSTGTLTLSPRETTTADASLEQLNPKARIWTATRRIPFATQLDLIVPNLGEGTASPLPVELEQLVRDKASYSHCPNINLALLLVPQFLNDFVRKGSLVGLSLGDDQGDDVVCIDGRGRLVLTVSKETYEVLGLPGRPSAFGSHGHKFVIEINLRDPAFRAGKPGFERTKRLLRDWPDRAETHHFAELVLGAPAAPSQRKAFEMVFTFVNDAGLPTAIDFPSSISSTIRLPHLSLSSSLSSIRVPSLLSPSSPFLPSPLPTHRSKRPRVQPAAPTTPQGEWHEHANELREWLGLVVVAEEGDEGLGIEEGGNSGDESEDEGVPRERCVKGDVEVRAWDGFFHPKVLQDLLCTLSRKTTTRTPFVSLSLHAPPHAPLSHLSARESPVTATRKKPNGKKIKRGRGTGEEEEGGGPGEASGWEVVLVKAQDDGKVEWCVWENV